MLRIVHEKHERHEKTSAVGFSLTASSPAFIHRLPRQALYVIHPGLWDAWVLAGTDICSCNICIPHIPVGYAGTQAQGGEASCYASIYGMCRHSDSPWPGVGQEVGLPSNVLMCFNYFRVFRGLRFYYEHA